MAVSSSMEIWLSSQIAMRLPSCWWPASALTSWLTPSSRSPSEHSTKIAWSNGLAPAGASGSSRPRSRRAAIAMPTALPSPWPSGPVVVSTPAVCPCSGCPGVSESHCRSWRRSASVEAVTGEIELNVESEAGVAAGEHEPIATRPVRVGRIMAHHPLEKQIGGGGEAHRGAGMAVAGPLHRVHRQGAHGCDRASINVGPDQGAHPTDTTGVTSRRRSHRPIEIATSGGEPVGGRVARLRPGRSLFRDVTPQKTAHGLWVFASSQLPPVREGDRDQ